MIQEMNGKLTHDKDQLQLTLQVVSEHKRAYPNCSKKNSNKYKFYFYPTVCLNQYINLQLCKRKLVKYLYF